MTMLTGRQLEQLQDALLDAFASRDALRMLARIELEQNLDAIAGGENLRVLVFNLISWAEQTGAVARLIDGACRQNAGNARLRDVQRELLPVVQRHFGRAVTKPPIAFDWVEIPAGPFLMGSDKRNDRYATEDEMPQHTVTLPAYRITRTPVTVAQFAAFVQATCYQTDAEKQGQIKIRLGSPSDEVRGVSWLHPMGPDSHEDDGDKTQDFSVTCVTWKDAVAFCVWASEATGTMIRLPTEAEWEKAARGTDGRIYPWGNEEPTQEHCRIYYYLGGYSGGPVGLYPKGISPYGVLDMVNLVYELTSTRWASTYQSELPEDHASLVLRGGAPSDWEAAPRCAVRTRDGFTPNNWTGFRVVSFDF